MATVALASKLHLRGWFMIMIVAWLPQVLPEQAQCGSDFEGPTSAPRQMQLGQHECLAVHPAKCTRGTLALRGGSRPSSVLQSRDISTKTKMRELQLKHIQAQREQTMELARMKARELARQVAGAVCITQVSSDSGARAPAAPEHVGHHNRPIADSNSPLPHSSSAADTGGVIQCSAIIPKAGVVPPERDTGAKSDDEWSKHMHVYMPDDDCFRALLDASTDISRQRLSEIAHVSPSSVRAFPTPLPCREMIIYKNSTLSSLLTAGRGRGWKEERVRVVPEDEEEGCRIEELLAPHHEPCPCPSDTAPDEPHNNHERPHNHDQDDKLRRDVQDFAEPGRACSFPLAPSVTTAPTDVGDRQGATVGSGSPVSSPMDVD